MNKNAILFIVLLLAMGIVFGVLRKKDVAQPASENNGTAQEQGMGMDDIVVALAAERGSGQAGTATFTDEAGKTKVVLSIASGAKDVAQPAHVHLGTCAAPGVVKYKLNDVVNGKSETVLPPALHFMHGLGQLIVNVHKSQAESGVYVACGDLTAALNDAMHVP